MTEPLKPDDPQFTALLAPYKPNPRPAKVTEHGMLTEEEIVWLRQDLCNTSALGKYFNALHRAGIPIPDKIPYPGREESDSTGLMPG